MVSGKKKLLTSTLLRGRNSLRIVPHPLTKGMRVNVSGRLEEQRWDDKETNEPRRKVVIIADEVSPSLRWATANVNKQSGKSGGEVLLKTLQLLTNLRSNEVQGFGYNGNSFRSYSRGLYLGESTRSRRSKGSSQPG
ncbi:MAG: hypothetical protein CM15mV33_490 [uncultured marine virus]|nr:MAG: hypothetical protein CM15mV33_490 [uncultured marine virus]